MRRIDALLDQYSSDHLNPTNQLIHVACVPAIVWSVTAMLWTIPVPGGWLQPGAWCAILMFLAWAYYWQLSKRLALGVLLAFVAIGFLNRWVADHFGMMALLWSAVAVFVVAWILQFVGHKIEGKRPSFLTDLVYLLVGPLWTLRKLYYRLGLAY
jgi:uncharacterized membrane protein YGL010W